MIVDDDDQPPIVIEEHTGKKGTTTLTPSRPTPPMPETVPTSEPIRPQPMAPAAVEPTRSTTETPSTSSSSASKPMNDADELWKATLEKSKDTGDVDRGEAGDLRQWTRYDVEAKRFRGSNSHGPLWGDVFRRITVDLDTNNVVADEEVTPEMTIHKVHKKLPEGIRSIETTLIYRRRPGHPDLGKPWPTVETAEPPNKKSRDEEPPEDARLIDEGLKRSLDGPAQNPRAATKSKLFPTRRADERTEWGNKSDYPIVVNARDLNLFNKVEKTDVFYFLHDLDKPITYLTKQSGKELDERKLPEHEKKMFNDAKLLEIQNLINSNRIMPSRYLIIKKTGGPVMLEKAGKPKLVGCYLGIKILMPWSWSAMHLHLPPQL